MDLASVANGAMTGTGMPSGSWARIVAARRSYSSPAAGASTGGAPITCSTVQCGARSPRRAMTSSRMSPSVVPGSVRQSISIIASPGITLYFTPARMMSGLIDVAQERAKRPGVHRVAQRADGRVAAARVRLVGDGGHERGRFRRQLRPYPVQELAHHGCQARLAGDGETTDRLRGHDRGVVLAGHGAVAPRAVDVDPEDLEALLGDLDRVEPAAAELHGDAAGLVEGAGGAERVGSVLREPARALATAGLLVGGAGVEDVAVQAGDGVAGGVQAGGPRLTREQEHDLRLQRHHLLHVHGASTPDIAVRDVGGERVVRPAVGGVRRDDIEVAEKQERVTAGAVAAEADGHVAAARRRLDDLRVQALGAQDAGDELRRRRAPGRTGPAG